MPEKGKIFLWRTFWIFYRSFFSFELSMRKVLDLIIFDFFNLLFLDYLKKDLSELLSFYWWFFNFWFFLITLGFILIYFDDFFIIILFGGFIILLV